MSNDQNERQIFWGYRVDAMKNILYSLKTFENQSMPSSIMFNVIDVIIWQDNKTWKSYMAKNNENLYFRSQKTITENVKLQWRLNFKLTEKNTRD